MASSTNRWSWAPHAAVEKLDRRGFVLNGDGVVCIDIDHCLDRGRVLPWAQGLVESLPDTYVEVSPGGDGLHVWGFGSVDRGRRIRVPGGTVEVYGSGRFMTVTGRRFGSSSSLADVSAVIKSLL